MQVKWLRRGKRKGKSWEESEAGDIMKGKGWRFDSNGGDEL